MEAYKITTFCLAFEAFALRQLSADQLGNSARGNAWEKIRLSFYWEIYIFVSENRFEKYTAFNLPTVLHCNSR